MDGSIHARLVKALAADVQKRTLAAVVKTLQSQPSSLAGEDSGLDDMWLQFAVQIQGEHSYDWDFYVLHVREVIEGMLIGLNQAELQALALQTPGGRDWLEAPDTDEVPVDTEALVDRLFGSLSGIAMDWEDDALGRSMSPGSDDYDDFRDHDEAGTHDRTVEGEADAEVRDTR